jgi:nicotinate-nucleotide adenylyltransferase
MRLGILGGSFNPVHHAHLILAERAVEALQLEKTVLMPTWVTPLNDPAAIAPARDRLAMVRLGARGNARLDVSDFELRRQGVSYTIETIRSLRKPGVEIFFLIGSDSLRTLPNWREIRELSKLVTFGIFARPASERLRVPTYIVYRKIDAPLLDISSTEIRARVRAGLSIRYLVPDAVERFIRRKGLYRS